jgi:hypothetical protein
MRFDAYIVWLAMPGGVHHVFQVVVEYEFYRIYLREGDFRASVN